MPGYYRQPAIHGDTVIFVCEDDLWSVSADGGIARRLTASRGAVAFPCFSPDGSRIAFTGRDDGPAEVYTMDSTGGPPRRVTFLGAQMMRTVGWTRDGSAALFSTHAGQPFQGSFHLHEVPGQGGPARRLAYGPAREIALERRGNRVVLGINSGDPARWKRYRGGTAGQLWIDRGGDGEFAPLLDLPGNVAGPMWIGSRVHFLSDHQGHGNLYSCTPGGRGLRRHTHHQEYYVRFPATDGRRIVYAAGADLYLFDPKSDETRRIDVELKSARAEQGRKFVAASAYLESADLHPLGHGLACVSRGAAFTFPLWAGAPIRHGPGSSARYRLARWLRDGRRIVAVSDEPGEEALVVARADGAGRAKRVPGRFGRAIDLLPAPAGADRVALTNHRQELWVVDLKTGKRTRVARSDHDRISGLDWSPDGRWLAYGLHVSRTASSIHLYDTRVRKVHEITRPDFVDFCPSFDPGGKYLYFLSRRVFDPIYDNQYFDLGFPRAVLPCLIPLSRKTPSPFVLATREPRPPRAPAGHEEDGKKKSKKPKVAVDLSGIADRVVAFPVDEAKYEAIAGAHGRVFFSCVPVEGSLNATWWDAGEPPAKAWLEAWDFERDRVEMVRDGVTAFGLSMDRKTLLVRVGNQLRALAASVEPKEIPAKDYPGRETGWIDLDRLSLQVEPAEEWRQMFDEAWRLQRDHFWTDDMSEVDWREVHDRYGALLDRVSSRSEFSDLMWEMQGELGTSHCYELGGDYRPSPQWHQGLLGADIEYSSRTRSWRIARIPRGDSWDRASRSPLTAPGLGVREGDEIVAVGGRRLGPGLSPHECLVNCARQEVALVIRSRGRRRRILVETMESEFRLRYRDWVEGNRARVHRRTRGRVGYVHVPDMGPFGYSEFHRYYQREVDRDGLIVDVRWNGGGHVSELLLEKLLRRRIGYEPSRWMGTHHYPGDAPMGPLVGLTNEMAGSDGDIFSHAWKLYKLGPLIGKRTWGGVVGIWPRHALVDGTVTTQPEFASWFLDVGYGVENYGTDPDIEVDITPQDHAAGTDTQLERGLVEMRRLLKEMKPRLPKMDRKPGRKPPRLP